MGNDADLVDQVRGGRRRGRRAGLAAAARTGRYRKQLDSDDRRHDEHGRRQRRGRSRPRCSSRSSSAGIPGRTSTSPARPSNRRRRTWRNKGATGFGASSCIELALAFATAAGQDGRSADERAAARRRRPSGSSGFLDGIERVGNKVPHPAIIFLGPDRPRHRAVSRVLAWAGRQVTYRGRRARAGPRSSRLRATPGRRTRRSSTTPERARSPTTRSTPRRSRPRACSPVTASGFIFTTAVQNFNDFGVVARHPGRDDRRRRGRGGRPDRRADPQDGQGRAAVVRSPSSSCCSAASRASPPTPATWC